VTSRRLLGLSEKYNVHPGSFRDGATSVTYANRTDGRENDMLGPE